MRHHKGSIKQDPQNENQKSLSSQSGWIKLHRRLLEWEWYSDSKTVHLFIHLLLSANHEARRWRGLEIKRGSLITSLAHLSESTGISSQSVKTCLRHLKSTNEITSKSTHHYTVITICNYDTYQINSGKDNQPNNQPNCRTLYNHHSTANYKQKLENGENEEKGRDITAPVQNFELIINGFLTDSFLSKISKQKNVAAEYLKDFVIYWIEKNKKYIPTWYEHKLEPYLIKDFDEYNKDPKTRATLTNEIKH